MKKYLENWRENDLIAFFTIASLLLCGWMQYIQFGKINIDSVLYFESAKSMTHGNWSQAIEIYNWPLYSACIAATHWMTGLTIEESAQLLNVIFFGMTTFSFLKIISLAGGKQVEIIFGALILFSARHIVGEMLTMQMRDEGFWAFFLTAIVFFIRFIEHQRYRDTLLWQTSIIIAMLFRVEAIGYLLLLPLVVFFTASLNSKWQAFFKSYTLALLLIAMLVLLTLTSNNTDILNASRLQEVQPTTLIHDLTSQLLAKSQLMASDILGKYLGDYAVESLLIAISVIIAIKSMNAIGLVNLGLATYTVMHRKNLVHPNAYNVLITASFISILNLIFTSIRSFVLVGRYTAALSFILLILATFSIRPLIKTAGKYQLIRKGALVFLALFILVNIGKNLRPELNQTFYMKEAAVWLNHKNQEEKPVLYDNILSRYYANEPYSIALRNANKTDLLKEKIASKEILHYAYLVINFNNDNENQKKALMHPLLDQYKELKRFKNQKNNAFVIIYEKVD